MTILKDQMIDHFNAYMNNLNITDENRLEITNELKKVISHIKSTRTQIYKPIRLAQQRRSQTANRKYHPRDKTQSMAYKLTGVYYADMNTEQKKKYNKIMQRIRRAKRKENNDKV